MLHGNNKLVSHVDGRIREVQEESEMHEWYLKKDSSSTLQRETR